MLYAHGNERLENVEKVCVSTTGTLNVILGSEQKDSTFSQQRKFCGLFSCKSLQANVFPIYSELDMRHSAYALL